MIYALITGSNCKDNVVRCLQSLDKQGTREWEELVVLDAPDDGSPAVIRSSCIKDRKPNLSVKKNKRGKLQIVWEGMDMLKAKFKPKSEDIIVFINANDTLETSALETVAEIYRKNADCLVTYGSYIKMSKGQKTVISNPYSEYAEVRKHVWRGWHLQTFKFKLWEHVPQRYLVDGKGDWFKYRTEMAVMFCLMELAGIENCIHIPEPIYNWNDLAEPPVKRKTRKKYERMIRLKVPLKKVKF